MNAWFIAGSLFGFVVGACAVVVVLMWIEEA